MDYYIIDPNPIKTPTDASETFMRTVRSCSALCPQIHNFTFT